MTRNTVLYLEDIVHNMRLAQQFVGNLTWENLSETPKLSMRYCAAWR